MEQTPHKYVTVAYELYADNEKGIHELIEKAPVEHPFQFISGMGVALDTFEDKILALTQGADFDFTLKQDDAYGPYVQEHVIELPKRLLASTVSLTKIWFTLVPYCLWSMLTAIVSKASYLK